MGRNKVIVEEPDISICSRDEVIESYLPLVRYLAQHISHKLPAHVDLEDLVHAGVLGLIDAVDKFDAERGIKFRTYADFRIRGAILDSLRSLDWVPRSIRKQKKIIDQTCARLEQRYGRQVTEDEICHELDIDIQEYYRLTDITKNVNQSRFIEVSNSDIIGGEDGDTGLAFVVDEKAADPFEVYKNQETIENIAEALKRLPEKEQQVVSMYYFDELTMKEIGMVMKITESRVSQLHTKAMNRLRATMSSKRFAAVS
ncbi:MAG: FliA/WhiG family RNA polymerase sigma factor [Acidobacteria bacterium]|nr:FliA/WhiG family RNA polymerase sigma factor [Acidobacteriota bacterium]